MVTGAGVEAFARTLDLSTGSAATCADLQDRTNALLTVGHSCILGAVSTGVYVETVKEGDETDQVRHLQNNSSSQCWPMNLTGHTVSVGHWKS